MLNCKTTLVVLLNLCCGLVCYGAEPTPSSVLKPPQIQTVNIEDGKPGFVVQGEKTVNSEAVDVAKMAPVLEKVEHALKGVQNRCARDEKLRPLSEVSIQSGQYPGHNDHGDFLRGAWIHIIAPTDEAFEIPTKGAPLKFKGEFQIDVQYSVGPTDSQPDFALHHGRVTWKTNDPHVSVALTWTTRDPKNAERLLKIVNEELQNQGIHMLPAQKLSWPAATPAERLAQLPTPDAKNPSAEKPPVSAPRVIEKPADGAGKIFATPEEVTTVYRRAYAAKDWQTCFQCLSPAARGETLQELYFVAALGNSPELVNVIEKHCKVKFFDGTAHAKVNKEMDALFLPVVKKIANHEVAEHGEVDHAAIYESFQKRNAEVPALVRDCCLQYRFFVDVGEVSEVTIAQDKAAGHWTQTIAPPAPGAFGGVPSETYLPRFYPFHFRKIGGSWLFEDAPLNQ